MLYALLIYNADNELVASQDFTNLQKAKQAEKLYENSPHLFVWIDGSSTGEWI